MECKNCTTELKDNNLFCNSCGAKVINHRLSFKSVTDEFFTTFISWDNRFLKTVAAIFIKPHQVVSDYLQGVRKRYMQPFAFLIVSLTLYGIFMYFGKEQLQEYQEYLASVMPQQNSGDPNFDQQSMEMNKKINDFTTRNFNLITFINIPLMAILNLLVFYKKLNFIEHIIALVYSYAGYLYGFFIMAALGLIFNIHFKYIYPATMVFMLIYHMFFFKKLFKLTLWQIIYKTIFFWILLAILMVILGIGMMILLMITGQMPLPRPNSQATLHLINDSMNNISYFLV